MNKVHVWVHESLKFTLGMYIFCMPGYAMFARGQSPMVQSTSGPDQVLHQEKLEKTCDSFFCLISIYA